MTAKTSARLALAVLALLVSLSSPAIGEDAARAPRSLDAFQHFSYAYAASHFGQKGWFGTPKGDAERIAIHIEDPESGILIELPPGVRPEAKERITDVLSGQGWEPGSPADFQAGNGPIYSYSPQRMVRVAGWNRGEMRLDLDPLVGALRELGGRPLFLCVRTGERLDFDATPRPVAAGVFHGARYAFYRLRVKDNGVLSLRYGVPDASLWLAALSVVVWLMVPLGVVAFVSRESIPAIRPVHMTNLGTFLPLFTAICAYGTLSLQAETLRLVKFPVAELPPPFDRLSFWILPLCVFLYLWVTLLVARRKAAQSQQIAAE